MIFFNDSFKIDLGDSGGEVVAPSLIKRLWRLITKFIKVTRLTISVK